MILMECCGLKGRPCGKILGYKIGSNKENSVSHGYCRSCYLETQLENGVATFEEKKELHHLLRISERRLVWDKFSEHRKAAYNHNERGHR